MRAKKAQGLPFKQIIVAAIVLLTLVIVAMIGPSSIRTGFNNLLKVIGLAEEEGTTAGDYILRASVKVIDESTVMLQFTPNPIRCAQIRGTSPYTITQGFVPYPEEYIPDAKFEEFKTHRAKGTNCGKRVTVDNITLIHPEEFGTRIIRIEVHGTDQAGVLETVPVEVNKWELLLLMYLNTPMSELKKEYDNDEALTWSYNMHQDPGFGFWNEHPSDQTLDLSQTDIDEALVFLGEFSNLNEGTFEDFLSKMACTFPEGNVGDASGKFTKNRAMQIVMTALFGDLQDFNELVQDPPTTSGQPVYRVRDGIGPRGYEGKGGYTNQVWPIRIMTEYNN